MKVRNIELPLANGETVKGNTIVDPTWNLSAQRYGARPENFCKSYEEIRKNDIADGQDHECHKNDEELQDCNLNLDDASLRMLFSSIGLANDKGEFPITEFMAKSKLLDEMFANEPTRNIEKQLLLLANECPEFAECQNSTTTILESVSLANENLQFDRAVVNRVYEREDGAKRPVLYVYVESEELGKRFYFADKNERRFAELSQEEFEKRFECYDLDLQASNGVRPWEENANEKENVDLARSSGKIVAAKEVDER